MSFVEPPRSGRVMSAERRPRLPSANAPVSEGRVFEAALKDASSKLLREHMEGLLNRVLELSERLSQSLSRQNLDEYREAVRQFLGQVIERSVQLRKDLREGNLLTVRTVNAALERLGNLVLEREKDRIALLEELGEIKGLLVSVRV